MSYHGECNDINYAEKKNQSHEIYCFLYEFAIIDWIFVLQTEKL